MKYIYSLFVITFLILISSCCTKEYRIPVVDLNYKNISDETQIYIYENSTNTEFQFKEAFTLKESNDYNYQLLTYEDQDIEYIVVLSDSIRIDTFTDVKFERTGRCKKNFKNFNFKHNGKLVQSSEINL